MTVLELTNYGSAGTAECPPDGIYTLEFTGHGQPEQVPSFNDPNKMVSRLEMRFAIVDSVEELDEDEQSYWIGKELREWVSIPKDMNNEKAKLGLILKALKGKKEIAVGEKIILQDYIGDRMRCSISAKESGWPKLEGYTAIKRRPKLAPKPAPPVADDGDDWPDE
jgi:hypothetical protein